MKQNKILKSCCMFMFLFQAEFSAAVVMCCPKIVVCLQRSGGGKIRNYLRMRHEVVIIYIISVFCSGSNVE